MARMRLAASVALLGLSISSAQAADMLGGYPVSSNGGSGDYWIVTLGGYGTTEPSWLGSNNNAAGFRPIIDIHRASDYEWLALPNDAVSLTLIEGANYRAGVAGDYLLDRPHEPDLWGLRKIDYTIELGGFAEYYPAPFFRTRVELLQGVTGSEGFLANLAADLILSPTAPWLFTVGPRLRLADTQYQSTFFSVDSGIQSAVSGLPPYHASGGVSSAGIDATALYHVNERLSLRAFAEWNRLEGDAANSPIVRFRGSEDQFEAGIGASYKFHYAN